MCRGELSAVIAQLMSNCEVGGSGREYTEYTVRIILEDYTFY